MNKGCNNCNNYVVGAINTYKDDTPSYCAKENTETLNKWWLDNAERLSSEGTINDPDCFEATKINILLDEMLDITEEMLAKFD